MKVSDLSSLPPDPASPKPNSPQPGSPQPPAGPTSPRQQAAPQPKPPIADAQPVHVAQPVTAGSTEVAAAPPQHRVSEKFAPVRRLYETISAEVGKLYVGQEELVLGTLTALFAGGHVLIESVLVSARHFSCAHWDKYSDVSSVGFNSRLT